MLRTTLMAPLAMAWVLACTATATAQSAQRPQPAAMTQQVAPLSQVETARFPALDLAELGAQDALRAAEGLPDRFAVAHDTGIDTRSAGTWEDLGTRSIWRYRVQAEGATSLNFGFTHYRLPASARLYIYDSAGRQLAGPWDSRKNEPHGQLWTPVIASADVVIELDVDTAERDDVELLLGRVNQGYRGFGRHGAGYVQPDIGQPKYNAGTCSDDEIASGTCNMDVACLGEDDPWNDPRRAVGAITIAGTDTCTGSLVNNTAQDRRRLFATATHCQVTAGTAPSMVVYWNYEWPTCRTPGTSASGQVNAPDPDMASSGATFIAATPNPFSSASCGAGMSATCTDWTLAEIDDPFDPAWNLYWEGWDRRSVGALCSEPADPTATTGLCASIHHPGVDEKRITFVPTPLTVSDISLGSDTHWHAAWDTTPPILPNIVNPPSNLPPGVTEGGSSGSPLFSPERRIVGVLSGGWSGCGVTGPNLSDEYGQLAIAWEGRGTPATRMKDHLDPLGSGAEYIDGMGMSPFTLALDPSELSVCAANTPGTTVDVAVAADAGFTDTVSLAVSGAPAGTTTDFSPSAVVPPGHSTLTIDGLDAAAAGRYAMTVSGSSGADSTSKTMTLAISSGMPGTTPLIAPANGASDVPTTAVLSWGAATGGMADYLVQVATDAGFTNIVFSRTVGDGTSVIVEPALAPNTVHYWRVQARNGCGDADWSTVRSFTTGITFPEPYCPVDFSTTVEPITLVRFAGIDNRSSATVDGSPAHEDFLGVPGGVVEPGETYPLRVEGNTAGNYTTHINAYIDWNRNGVFDSAESYGIGSLTNSTGEDDRNVTAPIAVPAGLASGPVRMRVTKKYNVEAGACNTDGWGQAEDYTLHVGAKESYTVSGIVSGLTGTDQVALSLNAGTPITVGNGPFTFGDPLPDGAGYLVTDDSPDAVQCQITNGSGTIQGADVTDVAVDCSVRYPFDIIFVNGFEIPAR